MSCEFYKLDSWYDANEHLANLLEIDSLNMNLYLFTDPHMALMDTLFGLSRQYIIKRKVFYFTNASPYLELPLQFMSMQSYDLRPLKYPEDLNDLTWMEELDSTTLAVIMSLDFPFLPHKNDFSKVEQLLIDKKVFTISLSHQKVQIEGLPRQLNDFSIELASLGSATCVGLFGRRAKLQPLFSAGMDWSTVDANKIFNKINRKGSDESSVKNFEKNELAEFKPVYEGEERYFDKAVVYWEDMDASALIETLKGEGIFKLQSPSLSRWGGMRTMDWLKNLGFKDSQIRGMLSIDCESIDDQLFTKILECRKSLLKKQGF